MTPVYTFTHLLGMIRDGMLKGTPHTHFCINCSGTFNGEDDMQYYVHSTGNCKFIESKIVYLPCLGCKRPCLMMTDSETSLQTIMCPVCNKLFGEADLIGLTPVKLCTTIDTHPWEYHHGSEKAYCPLCKHTSSEAYHNIPHKKVLKI